MPANIGVAAAGLQHLHRRCKGGRPAGAPPVQPWMALQAPRRNRPGAGARPAQAGAPPPPPPPVVVHRRVRNVDYERLLQTTIRGVSAQPPTAYQRTRNLCSILVETWTLDHAVYAKLILEASNVGEALGPATRLRQQMQEGKALASTFAKDELWIVDVRGGMQALADRITRMIKTGSAALLAEVQALVREVDVNARLFTPLSYAMSFREYEQSSAHLSFATKEHIRQNERDALLQPVPPVVPVTWVPLVPRPPGPPRARALAPARPPVHVVVPPVPVPALPVVPPAPVAPALPQAPARRPPRPPARLPPRPPARLPPRPPARSRHPSPRSQRKRGSDGAPGGGPAKVARTQPPASQNPLGRAVPSSSATGSVPAPASSRPQPSAPPSVPPPPHRKRPRSPSQASPKRRRD